VTTVSAAVSTPLLVLRDVAKWFRRGPERVCALDGVSLEVHPGELVGLVGPSGSGKTTLLNVAAGWERPDTGTIEWRSASTEMRALRWRSVAIVPQDLALLEELPIGENVTLPMRLDPEVRPALPVEDLLSSLGLGGLTQRMPGDVSLGEQQRTAIARALVAAPELLLADEPTAHQDETSTKRVLSAIRAAVDSGMAALVSTHSPEVIDALDRIVSIRDGLIVSPQAQRG
jgi:putative ABC transport system ATP-binding protein